MAYDLLSKVLDMKEGIEEKVKEMQQVCYSIDQAHVDERYKKIHTSTVEEWCKDLLKLIDKE